MRLLNLGKTLLCTSAILFFGAIAISVLTQDAWLALAHATGLVSAAVAALAVLIMLAGVLGGWGGASARPDPGPVLDHEQGQAGWD